MNLSVLGKVLGKCLVSVSVAQWGAALTQASLSIDKKDQGVLM